MFFLYLLFSLFPADVNPHHFIENALSKVTESCYVAQSNTLFCLHLTQLLSSTQQIYFSDCILYYQYFYFFCHSLAILSFLQYFPVSFHHIHTWFPTISLSTPLPLFLAPPSLIGLYHIGIPLENSEFSSLPHLHSF